jgi:histone-lysine N-methyltransferase SETD8
VVLITTDFPHGFSAEWVDVMMGVTGAFPSCYSVDATAESGRLGRLVNHSRSGNLITKTVCIVNQPHLVLIAKEDIPPGEEVMYDYGDRSKESIRYHPWLAA